MVALPRMFPRPPELAAEPPRRRRRPTTPTPELVEAICARVRIGVPVEAAAASLGVMPATLAAWNERGKRQEAPGACRELLQAVARAEAACQLHLVALLQRHARNDWRAAAWLLERRWPDEWGQPHTARCTSTGVAGVARDALGLECPPLDDAAAARLILEAARGLDADDQRDSRTGPSVR